MPCQPFSFLDGLKARNPLRGSYASIAGVVASFVMIALLLWLYIPITVSYFQGKHFQSFFFVQQPTYDTIHIPDQFRTALIFYNRTTGALANHSQLAIDANFHTYLTNHLGLIHKDGVAACQSNYFQNVTNPTTLQDCFLFPNQKAIDFSFYSINPTNFGFQSSLKCLSPFNCSLGGTGYSSAVGNYTSILSDYTFSLLFTSRTLTASGEFKDTLFTLSSQHWTTPHTPASSIGVQLQLINTTLDDSILPWKNTTYKSYSAWQGIAQGVPVPLVRLLALPPKAYFYNGHYQIQYYRYNQKADKLLGIIGGGIFLLLIIFSVPFLYINQCRQRMQEAEQMLIEHFKHTQGGPNSILPIKVSNKYFYQRLFPLCGQNQHIKELVLHNDLGRLIMMMKVAEKNIHYTKILAYKKERCLQLKQELQRSQRQQRQRLRTNNGQNQSRNDLNQDEDGPRIQEEHLENRLQREGNNDQQLQIAQNLNLHPKILETILNTPSMYNLLATNLTFLALTNQQTQYKEQMQDYQYNRHSTGYNRKGRCETIKEMIVSFFRYIDIFRVKIQLNPFPNTSCFGFIVTFLIIGLTVLFCITATLNLNSYQIMGFKSFQQPQQINYQVTTGDLFRPFLCFDSTWAIDELTASWKSVSLSFYTQTSKGTVLIPAVLLSANQHSYLGITPDSPYSSIFTEYCFVMSDNHVINMGGINTPDQAYWGIKIDPYCTGTASSCNSINSFNLYSFIDGYSSILYLPFYTINPITHSLAISGFYPQQIRKGQTFTFTTPQNSVRQTIYVDQTRILDDYSPTFVGQKPKTRQQTISANRYQAEPNIEGIPNNNPPFYDIRIRPSGVVSDIILKGMSLEVYFAIIAGIGFLFYLLLHCIPNKYNHYLLRSKMAQQVYLEDYYEESSFWKSLFAAFPIPLCLCCSKSFVKEVKKMRIIDKKIKQDLDVLEMVKDIIMIHQLSAAQHPTSIQKHNSLIYFKQKIVLSQNQVKSVASRKGQGPTANESFSPFKSSQRQMMEPGFQNQQQHFGDLLDSQGSQLNSEHQSEKRRIANTMNESDNVVEGRVQDIKLDERVNRIKSNQDNIKISEEYRSPQGMYKNAEDKKKYFDCFSSQAQLTLNGEWRVKSCFGGILTLGLIVLVLLLSAYSIHSFNDNRQLTISHDQKMLSNNQPPLVLHSDNFRMGFGFYQKPNSSFLDVSSFINSSSTITIGITQHVVTKDPNTNISTTTSITTDLVPCPSNYFDNHLSPNIDYSFLSGLNNGFCLPSTLPIPLTLTTSLHSSQQFATINIYDRVSNSSAQLSSLLNSYVVGLLMTVPIIDLQSKTFKHSVQRIGGQLDAVSRAFYFNLTLSKQEIDIHYGNYSINSVKKISTYNYLNTGTHFSHADTTGSALRTYTISLTYNPLVDTYILQERHFAEVFGITGALILFFYCLLSIVGQSFNSYKERYMIGKQLYLPVEIVKSKVKSNQKGKKASKFSIVSSQDFLQTDFNQAQLFSSWIFYFPAKCFKCKSFNTIYKIQQLADQDLDLYSFFKKYRNLKDTVNQFHTIPNNPNMLATNLFTKLPFIRNSGSQIQQFSQQKRTRLYLQKQNISSYQQNKLLKLRESNQPADKLFDDTRMQLQFLSASPRVPPVDNNKMILEADELSQVSPRRKENPRKIQMERQRQREEQKQEVEIRSNKEREGYDKKVMNKQSVEDAFQMIQVPKDASSEQKKSKVQVVNNNKGNEDPRATQNNFDQNLGTSNQGIISESGDSEP